MIKYLKKNKNIFVLLTIFCIISILSIYSFSPYLSKELELAYIKQLAFYTISFVIIFIISKLEYKKIIKYSFIIYAINIALLILVLVFGKEINGTKAWFSIPLIGSFQPSEFMKIGLILFGSKIVENTKINTSKDEILLIIKLLIISVIPSILTFLEPDTGSVIIYFIIFFALIFISNIRVRWIITITSSIIIIIGIIFYLYHFKQNIFIELFGNSLFYRLDRIFEFVNSEGMQLENSIIAIASAGLIGNGLLNVPIYYPEGQTDFIFTTYTATFGLIGVILLILTIIVFDITFIKKAKQETGILKYITFSFICCIIFCQIENISMTIGLLPIIGITLPFISYGGSSLLSFMILLGIILCIEKNNKKYYNK